MSQFNSTDYQNISMDLGIRHHRFSKNWISLFYLSFILFL